MRLPRAAWTGQQQSGGMNGCASLGQGGLALGPAGTDSGFLGSGIGVRCLGGPAEQVQEGVGAEACEGAHDPAT